jgi:hypothetical protein
VIVTHLLADATLVDRVIELSIPRPNLSQPLP